jgi:putative membrane protein insertion efficiency factor
MCRFSPTCSEYAIVALETHGLVRGSLYAVWRILRCNPLCEGGHDPVPGSEPCDAPDEAVDERPPARQDPPS